MLFFCTAISEFNKGYVRVLGDYDEEDEEESQSADNGEDSGDGSGVEDKEEVSDAEKQFRWLSMIDAVSETTRLSWDAVYRMNIYEFFNIYFYAVEKNRRKQKSFDNLRNTR